MTTTRPKRPAPIATDQDRRAIAHIVARIAPDWDYPGVRSVLARAEAQQIDILAVSSIIAAVTRADQLKPAILAMTGEHLIAALNALDTPPLPSPLPAAYSPAPSPADRCGLCRQLARHHTPATGHPWEPPKTGDLPTPTRLAELRAIALNQDAP